MREDILEFYEDVVFADGFDDAIIGVDEGSSEARVVYSITKCVELLAEQGMSYEDAVEYLYFNVIGAYVGPNTPVWVNDSFSKTE